MALPQQAKSARLTNSSIGDTIDDGLGNAEKAFADILGITADTDVNRVLNRPWGSRGQASKNNTGTPNTKFDLIADAWIFGNSGKASYTRFSPSTVTVDVTVAGPAANGRDQAGVFSASSWLHFYIIDDITGVNPLAGIVSLTAPPTGPTLPSGYTHWSYAGAVRFNASSQLRLTRIRANFAFYDEDENDQLALSAGVATSFTSVDLSAFIPPNALASYLELISSGNHATPGTSLTARLRTTGTAAANGNNLFVANVTQVAGQTVEARGFGFIPNVSQTVDYRIANAPAGGGAYIAVFGYLLPNGGC